MIAWRSLLLFPIFLFAKFSTEVTENDPASFVENVSVITGEYYSFDEDVLCQGAEPFVWPRAYSSAHGSSTTIFHSEHRQLRRSHRVVDLKEPNGTAFTYARIQKSDPTIFRPLLDQQGITNTSKLEISGQSNIKNQYIKMEPDGKSFVVFTPQGIKRRYRLNKIHQEEELIYYLLDWEQFPDGKMRYYDRDKKENITNIKLTTRNQTILSAIYPNHQHPTWVHYHDGRVANVRLNNDKTRTIIDFFSLPDEPDQHFFYTTKGNRPVLSAVQLPSKRRLEIEYEDQAPNRVKYLKLPVGENQTPIVAFSFLYSPDKKSTCVTDALGNNTDYFWDGNSRLTRIDYKDKDAISHSELFEWDDTLIQSKTLQDKTGKVIYSHTYSKYDGYGNPEKRGFSGYLSGEEKQDEKEKTETCLRKTKYSQDGKNLLERSEEQNGKTTTYSYLKGYSLIEEEKIHDGEALKIKTKYDYDNELFVVGETLQDEICHLKKTITRIPSTNRHPIEERFFCMPKTIEYKMGDDTLLKKEVLHYEFGGFVGKKDVYDANDKHRYSISKKHTHKGLVEEENNPIGQIASYKYDDLGNCLYSKDFSDRLETYQTFNLCNQLTEKREVGFDKIERITTYTYDNKNQLRSETDFRGQTTFYEYDPFGHLTETHLPLIPNSENKLQSAVIKTEYNAAGHVISKTDAEGFQTLIENNAYGKPIHVKHPDGTQDKYTYYLNGNLKTHTDPQGFVTSYEYDYLNRITKIKKGSDYVETFTYKGLFLTEKIDAEGNSTTYSYDKAGRKILENVSGEITTYTYDEFGRLATTQTGNLISITEYDLLGRVKEERQEEVLLITNPEQPSASGNILRKVQYGYDAAGNRNEIVRFINGKEEKELLTYDSMNRLICKQDALGNIETIEYDDIFLNEHKQKVLCKTHKDPIGLQTIEIYNTRGQVASIEKRNKITLSLEEKWYDQRGLLTLQINTIYNPDQTLRRTTTEWEYDSRGRLKTLKEAKETPEEKITTYTYTPNGQIETVTKPSKVVLTYTYDDLGHLKFLKSSDQTVQHTTKYNRLGHLIQTDTITRTVDPKGRLLTETFPHFSLTNTYDTRGRRETCTIPQADCLITYTYSAAHLSTITRKNLQQQPLYQHTYTQHDLSGNLLSQTLINQQTLTYEIDPLSRKKKITSPHFTQEVLEFDALSNIHSLQTREQTFAYTYDSLYQLLSETGPIPHVYTYDTLYNRLKKDTETYTPNALQQIPSHFTHDPNGNPKISSTVTYSYDALDRLLTVITSTAIHTYTYDSLHRRLSQTITTANSKKTTYFLYDGQNEIGSFDDNFSLQELRILGATPQAEIGASIAIELPSGTYVPIHDLHGNIATLIPLNGSEPLHYQYTAFGEEVPTNPTICPWRFSSKRLDPTQLVYYGRRYYIPAHGRWLTPDPAGFTDGMNLYAFVHNDPLTHIDAYGLIDYGQYDPKWKKETALIKTTIHKFPRSMLSQTAHITAENIAGFGRMFNSNWMTNNKTFFRDYQSWDQREAEMHRRIDDFFGTNLKNRYRNPLFLELGLPLPGLGMFSTAGKVASVGKNTLFGFTKHLLKPNLGNIALKNLKEIDKLEKTLKIGKFTYSNTAAKHFSEFIKRGPNAGRLSRPYMKSSLTIEEIMAAKNPVPDPGGISGGLRWDVPGSFRGTEGTWELVLHPETNIIYHYNFK